MATGKLQNVADFLDVLPDLWPTSPMTEGELVRLGIAFANRPTFARWSSFIYGSKRSPRDIVAKGRKKAMDMQFKANIADEHVEFLNDLTAVLSGTPPAPLAQTLATKAARMILVPSCDAHSDRAALTYRYMPEHISAALAYVCRLILMDERYGKDIFRCQLPGCGRFFFSSMRRLTKVGAPPRKYCSDRHMKLAHDANASLRVAKSRRNAAARDSAEHARRASRRGLYRQGK